MKCPQTPRVPVCYNRYDTSLITLFALGKEQLVPDHLRALVPHSTASAWRKRDVTSLLGHELRAVHAEALDFHALFARHQRLRSTVIVLAKVWMHVSDIVLPVLLRNKAHGERLVNAVQLLFTVMPRRKALRIVDLSSSAFHDRITWIKLRCGLSPLDRCFARHPLQLALREVGLIKDLFADPAFHCWPACSIYYHAARNLGLGMALSTFYKYMAALGLKRSWPKATRKSIGIRASKPNEFLHIDTTFYEFQPQVKAAIVLVSDNFSKALLGVHVAPSKHAAHVVEALAKAIDTIQQQHPQDVQAILVADGGRENHNELVDGLISSVPQPLISKITALKDIAFSNSPIEAINKILKRYLRYHKPTSFQGVQRVVDLFVYDYGSLRPHGALKGLTPMERYVDPARTLDLCPAILGARARRIEENKRVNCSLCLKTTAEVSRAEERR